MLTVCCTSGTSSARTLELVEPNHVPVGRQVASCQTHVDALEPDGDVRDKGDLGAELLRDLSLVDVVRQAVRDDVVREILDVVLRRRLGPRSRVARHAEHGWLAAEMRHQRRDGQLGRRRVAAGVRDPGRLGDLGARHELREPVRPAGIEAEVGAEVDDERVPLRVVYGVDPRLAHAVRQRHDPAVNLALLLHAADVVRGQVLVVAFALVVADELLSGQLPRRDVP